MIVKNENEFLWPNYEVYVLFLIQEWYIQMLKYADTMTSTFLEIDFKWNWS